jgi:hypothetical protein
MRDVSQLGLLSVRPTVISTFTRESFIITAKAGTADLDRKGL